MKTINYKDLDFSAFVKTGRHGYADLYEHDSLKLAIFRGDEQEHFWVDPINFNVIREGADSEDLDEDGFFNLDARPEYCYDCICGRGEGCDCDGMEAKAAEDEMDYE